MVERRVLHDGGARGARGDGGALRGPAAAGGHKSARVLAVTIQVSRYRKLTLNLLAVQLWRVHVPPPFISVASKSQKVFHKF